MATGRGGTTCDVFICFRPDTSLGAAAILRAHLSGRGIEGVFASGENSTGEEWSAPSQRALDDARVVVVVITPGWLNATVTGRRQFRLDNEGDAVRREIEKAIAVGAAVIPVVFEGADLPKRETLPVSIRPLVDRKVVEVLGYPNHLDGLNALAERIEIELESAVVPAERVAGSWDVFISYRHQSDDREATLLESSLKSYGITSVFRDHSALVAGKWRDQITTALSEVRVVLVIITKDWLREPTPGQLRYRLDNQDDPVRNEIQLALQSNAVVIPVLFDGTTLPQKTMLPVELQELTECQAYEVGGDKRREADLKALADGIKGIVDPSKVG